MEGAKGRAQPQWELVTLLAPFATMLDDPARRIGFGPAKVPRHGSLRVDQSLGILRHNNRRTWWGG